MAPTKFTVAFVGYRRPGYTKQSLEALSNCVGFHEHVERVILSIDDANGKGSALKETVHDWTRYLEKDHWILLQPRLRGIVGNSVLSLKAAFDFGAKNVLYLEDDAVLSPDALKLASWMVERDRNRYLLCGLSRGNKPLEPKNPGHLVEGNVHPCPYAWTITEEMWPFVLKNWCNKHYQPCGWSFAITHNARMAGKAIFLAPQLARVKNIGRDDGTNGDRYHWDSSLRDIPTSDGSYSGEYEVVESIDAGPASAIDQWMLSEIEKTPALKMDNWLGFGRPEELGPE